MNYQLIKILCKRRGFTESHLIRQIEMTPQGYYSARKKETLTVEKLEKISEVLKVNPCLFFRDDLENKSEQDIKLNLVDEQIVDYLPKKDITAKHSDSTELVDLMRFKISALEKELKELKAKG